jgi:hypothetical protein
MDFLNHWLTLAVLTAVAAGIALWTAGAIYFDVGDRTGFRRPLTAVWLAAVVALFLLWQPLWRPFVALLVAFGLFLVWWLRLKPSQHRDWAETVARLPRAEVAGDAVRLHNVWSHDYRTFTDFTPNYVIRTVHLSNLVAADVLFFYWGSPWMSHPVLCFDFGPDGRVCCSIEVRYRKGQGYALLPSLYRQQEITVCVTDEYDAIARRTKYGTDDGYLYRLGEPPDRLRTIFLDYVAAVNHLYRTPEWYHGLCANCTTTFYRLPNSRPRCDWRVLVNGRLDRALYEAGVLDRSVPFEVLRRTAYLNDVVRAAPRDGFGEYVRAAIAAKRAG